MTPTASQPASHPASPPASEPAWTGADLASDPHAHAHKAEKVRRMFGAIAHRYDLNNRLHSFGRDQAWRRAAVRMSALRPGEAVLDCACGTGDLTRAFADAGAGRTVGLDFTPEMLDIARTKRLVPRGAPAGARPGASPGGRPIEYIEGDAMNLPFAAESFDVVSIAFGIRNVADPACALREFHRVLRPGGRLVVLEFARPRSRLVAWGNDLYTKRIMPITATLISADRSGAYRYLPRSIDTFLTPGAMAEALHAAGFAGVRQKPMTLGVCVCTVAHRS
ncbi:MAG TPA: bifunctional demethylmenaquinone methyltransferase/2-methoxy-6-polyprenyl-1,4-benzoquinol methylase UbiE [Phycisphaerales bacterium]|nr:bifunctional demethylmenaquinone methyltransferase/2-methoxy-6-polyprenyl-1,4-benzoquinol methylase UbiE [Phycisphaerales bacterium]